MKITIEYSSGLNYKLKLPVQPQVGDVIQALTDALLKVAQSDFSTESVIIEIESPDVPDLTIIDLPGIVRTVTTGQVHLFGMSIFLI